MVQDMDGVHGTVLSRLPHAPRNAMQVVVAANTFVQQPDDCYCLPRRLTALSPVDSGPGSDAGALLVLAMTVEELDVYKWRVETHHPQQVTLWREEARVVERLNSPE
jgi:hypothetical protein